MILFYRLLTYLLLPFAVLFAGTALVIFFAALGNPTLFMGVFLLASFSIYTYCCLRLLHTGILPQRPLKVKLRDWIKVNAYVAMPMGILSFMNSFTVISKPSMIKDAVTQMGEMQQRMGMPAQPAESYERVMVGMMYVVLVFSIILLVHILMTFSILKKYRHLFGTEE